MESRPSVLPPFLAHDTADRTSDKPSDMIRIKSIGTKGSLYHGYLHSSFWIWFSECIKNDFYHICLRIFMKRTGCIRCTKICLFRIKHAETIMMLSSKDNILHTGDFCHLSPGSGINVLGMKRFVLTRNQRQQRADGTNTPTPFF